MIKVKKRGELKVGRVRNNTAREIKIRVYIEAAGLDGKVRARGLQVLIVLCWTVDFIPRVEGGFRVHQC